jgi:hypothetical protein
MKSLKTSESKKVHLEVEAGNVVSDPFSPRQHSFGASFVNALLATALFRCWHILILYAAWSTAVTVINVHHKNAFIIQPTLLTVYVIYHQTAPNDCLRR